MTWKHWIALVALGLAPTVASAQHSCPTCRTATGPTCKDKDCGVCGLKQSPLLESRYIRQFCRPTICPSSCFGHFKTQWTPWNVACQNWSEGNIEHVGLSWGPPPHPSYGKPSAPETVPIPEAKTNGEPEPVKKPMAEPPPKGPAPVPPSAPLPKVDIPKSSDNGGRPGVSLPPVPDLPINIPLPLPDPLPVSPAKY